MDAIFIEASTCKALAIHRVIKGAEEELHRGLLVNKLGDLDLLAFGFRLNRSAVSSPVDVIEYLQSPLGLEVSVTLVGLVNEVGSGSWCGCGSADVSVNAFGYESAIVKECCQCSWDPLREDTNVIDI